MRGHAPVSCQRRSRSQAVARAAVPAGKSSQPPPVASRCRTAWRQARSSTRGRPFLARRAGSAAAMRAHCASDRSVPVMPELYRIFFLQSSAHVHRAAGAGNGPLPRPSAASRHEVESGCRYLTGCRTRHPCRENASLWISLSRKRDGSSQVDRCLEPPLAPPPATFRKGAPDRLLRRRGFSGIPITDPRAQTHQPRCAP
jgi:hypothetical protein